MALGLNQLSPEKRIEMGLAFKAKPSEEQRDFILSLEPEEREELLFDPFFWMRKDQLPNFTDEKNIVLIMAGRGFGKSFSGMRYAKYAVEELGVKRLAFLAPTLSMVRDTMINGESGLMSAYSDSDPNKPTYIASQSIVKWPCGATAVIVPAENGEKIRGSNVELAICDEICSWKDALNLFTNLEMATRLGNSQILITTTPSANDLILDLYKRRNADVLIQTGSTLANRENLSSGMVKRAESLLGTTIGRREVEGIYVPENDSALWSLQMLTDSYVYPSEYPPKEWERACISLDPSGSNKKTADLFGINLSIKMKDGKVVCWEDLSGRYSSEQWAKIVVNKWREMEDVCPTVIAVEENGVGAFVKDILLREEEYLPIKGYANVTKKYSRAMSVSHLFETNHVKMNRSSNLSNLEEEMVTFDGTGSKSPDRLDSFCGAVEELIGKRGHRVFAQEFLF